MSREIKFRAWITGLKKMETGLFGLRSDGKPSFNSEAILMQYTGLKDKNDKEIYEGDIVLDGENTRQVKFSSQNASFYLSTVEVNRHYYKEFIECGQSQSDEAVHCDTIEIIGNIYENPELIK